MRVGKGMRISEIAIIAILVGVIVVPLGAMFVNIKGDAFTKVFTNNGFFTALVNSLLATTLATLISLVIAYALAWAVNRTNIKFKAFWSVVLILPMLIPSISHGSGLIILFGQNGIITNMFSAKSSIYGLWGIVIGSVLYSYPVAFLMISDVLKYQDYSPYAAASVLRIPKLRQFTAITMPYMKKPLISVVFATFTLIFTDYGVPLSVGGKFKTLPVMLFEEAVGMMNYSVGSVIGLVLIVPALIAFLFDLFNKDKSRASAVSQPFTNDKNGTRDIIAYVICSLVTLFTLMIFTSFCVQAFAKKFPHDKTFSFANFSKAFNNGAGVFLLNSLLMSILTALIGTIVAFIIAYFTARGKTKTSKALHLLSITSLAIPGLVLGLSYVIIFKQTFFYGTVVILIMVNIVHFVASPYLMIYNALGKVHESIEDVGLILGVSRIRIITGVIIPQTKYTLFEMFSYFFVNSMMTISAVSFLSTTDNKPLSLLINQFEAYGMIECAAVVAIIILLTNVAMKLIVGAIKKFGEKKNDNKKTV